MFLTLLHVLNKFRTIDLQKVAREMQYAIALGEQFGYVNQ